MKGMISLFTVPNAWSGESYSLLLKWGPLDDQQVHAVFGAVWRSPGLTGVYLRRDREPQEQHRWSAHEINPLSQLTFGTATLSGGHPVPCLVTMQRDENEAVWLDCSFATQALPGAGNALCEGASTNESSAEWIHQVEAWLADLGRAVGTEVPFDFGLIGYESALDGTEEIQSMEGIPNIRNVGYLWQSEEGVRFFPTTDPL